MRFALLLTLLICLPGCASSHDVLRQGESEELRRAARRGDPVSARRLAEVIARGQIPGATLAEAIAALEAHPLGSMDRALLAELEAARLRRERAFEHWIDLVVGAEHTWLRGYAAVRALQVVDRVPLTDTHAAALAGMLGGPGDGASAQVAALAYQVGLRLRDPTLLARAREALGAVHTYRVSPGRISSRPALDLAGGGAPVSGDEPKMALGAWTSTRDGVVFVPDDGPGVYVLQVPIPLREGPWELELRGTSGTSVQTPDGTWITHNRLVEYLPGRLRVRLPAGAPGELTLRVGTRVGAARLQIWLRPSPPEWEAPSGEHLVGRLARLWDGLWRESVHDAGWAAERLNADAQGVASLALARHQRGDESIPDDVGRPVLHHLLSEARRAILDLDAATLILAQMHLEEGDLRRAEALMGTLGSELASVELALAIAQEQDNVHRQEWAVESLRRQLPTSCSALLDWLIVHRERLRARPDQIPSRETGPGCLDVQLELASVEVEAWALDRAEARLDGLDPQPSPGTEEEIHQELRVRIAVGRGQEDRFRRMAEDNPHASDALLWRLMGVGSAEITESQRARWVQSRGLDSEARRLLLHPRRHLGLPLADPLPLLQGSMAHDHSALVLLHDVHTTVLQDGAVVRRYHRLVHLGDEDAVVAWGEQGLPEAAELLRARTWEKGEGGTWRSVSAEDLPDTGAVSLPRVAVGVVTEVAWLAWEPSPLDAREWSRRFLPRVTLSSDMAATGVANCGLVIPPSWGLEWETTGAVPAPESLGDGRWRWRVRDLPRDQPEPRDPRPERRTASVRAIVSPPDQIGKAGALQDGGLEEVLWSTRPSPRVARLAAELLQAAGDSPLSRLRALYEGVLREVEQGSEVSVIGSRAAFAAVRLQGNRTALLLSMCQISDLSCELVMARPRSRGVDQTETTPVDPDDWVYPLIRASLGEREVWLDLATPYSRFDHIPPEVQDVSAMRLRPEGGRLRTPVRDNGTRHIALDLWVKAGGEIRAQGVEEISGFVASGWRRILNPIAPERRDRVLRSLVQRVVPGFEVEEVVLTQLEARDGPLGFRWSAHGRMEHREHVGSFSLHLSPEKLSQATLHQPERSTPLWLERFTDLTVEVGIRLPTGWEPRYIPKVVRAGFSEAVYKRDAWWDGEDRVLSIRKRFQLKPLLVLAGQYSTWVEVAQAVDAADALYLEVISRPER